jgi:hypothetical protein
MAQTFSRPIQLALEHERRILWLVALFPLLAMMATATFKLMPRLYMFLTREDSVVEWATAVVYVLAAGFAVSSVLHFRRNREWLYVLLYGVLGAGMFLIAMEEISWGQRQLGIETPHPLADINWKGELNFHNISGFPLHEVYIAVGFYGAFSRLIAAPLLSKRFPKLVDLVTPPCVLFLFFFIPFLYYAYNEYLYYTELLPRGLQWAEYWRTNERFIGGKESEPIELLLSLGFLLFTVLNWIRYRVGAPLTLGGTAGTGLRASDGPISAKKPAAF